MNHNLALPILAGPAEASSFICSTSPRGAMILHASPADILYMLVNPESPGLAVPAEGCRLSPAHLTRRRFEMIRRDLQPFRVKAFRVGLDRPCGDRQMTGGMANR